MKAEVDGVLYDTEEAEALLHADDGALYQAASGHFFLVERRESRTGREAFPCQRTDPRQALRNLAFSLNNPQFLESAESLPEEEIELRRRWEILVPMTEEAAAWAVKSMLPDCFHEYLLERS